MKCNYFFCILLMVIHMNRLKDLRNEKDIKQSELAELLHVSTATISRYEKGVRDLDTGTLAELCRFFSVSSDYLLGISDFRSNALSREDAELLAAYHAADEDSRSIVDMALKRFKPKTADREKVG